MAAREWIEARVRAEQTVAATRKALTACPAEYRAKIEEAVKEVEILLRADSGDVKALKGAHAALDEATKPLAEILMDRAMEAMLRKQGIIS